MDKRINYVWIGYVFRWSVGLMAVMVAMLVAGLSPAFADSTNLITNGDFSAGNTGFSSAYTYGNVTNPGTYVIGSNPSMANGAFSDWGNYGAPGGGNMMIVNGGNSATEEFWDQTLAVTANTTYTFSFDVAQVDADSGGAGSLADLDSFFNSASGGTTGAISAFTPANGGSWALEQFTWNSGSATTLDLSLTDLNTDTDWNDFAITDLSLTAQSSSVAPTPEPPSVLLLMLGLGLLGLLPTLRRSTKASAL